MLGGATASADYGTSGEGNPAGIVVVFETTSRSLPATGASEMKFAANISFMFNEWPPLERFKCAADAGFATLAWNLGVAGADAPPPARGGGLGWGRAREAEAV